MRLPTIVSADCSVRFSAAAAEVEDHHAWMVVGRGHLERDLRVEDAPVERDDAIDIRGHRRNVIEACAHRHAPTPLSDNLWDRKGSSRLEVKRLPLR